MFLSEREKILASLLLISLVTIPLVYVYASSMPILNLNPYMNLNDYSYLLLKSGSVFYGKNGSTGALDFVDSSFSDLFNHVQSLLVRGGVIKVNAGLYPIESTLNITYRGIHVEGAGNNLTVFYPTGNIDIIRVKLPAYQFNTSSSMMINYEMGEDIIIKNIKFYDPYNSPKQTSKASIVLDNSESALTGITIRECVFDGVYDGIVNYRGAGSNYLWSNTIECCKFNLFRHHAIMFDNVADTVLRDLWIVTDQSSVSAIKYRFYSSGSTKIGGNIFDSVRVFNEKTVTGANGIEFIDYHEIWMSNCILDFNGGHGSVFNNTYDVFVQNSWFSTNNRADEEGAGIYICSNPHHQSTYGNPYNFQFVNVHCYGQKYGLKMLGTGDHVIDRGVFTGCFFSQNTGAGVILNYSKNVIFNGGFISSNTGLGIVEGDTCSYNLYTNLIFATNTGSDLVLDGAGSEAHQYFIDDVFTD